MSLCVIPDDSFPEFFYHNLQNNLSYLLHKYLDFHQYIEIVDIIVVGKIKYILFYPNKNDVHKLNTHRRFFIPNDYGTSFQVRWFKDLNAEENRLITLASNFMEVDP